MGRRIFTLVILGMLAAVAACGDGHVGNAFDASTHDARAIDASGTDCAGLDVAVCRQTSGCVADFCDGCSCEQTYMGCRAEAETPAQCPPLLCPAPTCCEGGADCDASSRECHHPGESPGCGPPNIDPGDCTIDAECDTAGGEICEPIACSSVGAFHCVMGCTGAGDCQTGTECNPEHRCTSQPCDDINLCPTDFHCDENFCARDTCTLDIDCAGFCVEGLCYDQLGTCAPIPA